MATLGFAPRIRVGIFARSRQQEPAIAEAMGALAGSDFAEIVSIALDDGEAPVPSFPWRCYARLDAWISGLRQESVTQVDLLDWVPGVQVISGQGGTAKPDWQAGFARLGLDVVFVLGHSDPHLDRGMARYGIWSFDLGNGEQPWDGLEGYRQVLAGETVTAVSLRVQQSGQPERQLYASSFRTVPFFISKNRDRLWRRAAQLPARALQALHRSRNKWPVGNQGQFCSRRLPFQGQQVLHGLFHLGTKVVQRLLQKLLTIEQWFLAFRFSSDAREAPDSGPYRCLMPPRDRFWADPFPLHRDGRFFIFFEELVFAEGKAHISVMEIDPDGNCSSPQRVLERPYHLSYPFLIATEGNLFMVPETGENGTVELYRCEHFPDRWQLQKVLLEGAYCADATIHKLGQLWWMFVNMGSNDMDVHDELHLYYATTLEGPWFPHAGNPVKSDVRSARSAGRPYTCAGQLYRPAQVGVPIYGSGISINKIVKLTPMEYLEQEVDRIIPPLEGRMPGVHTLNRAGMLTVVDGFIRRSRFGFQQPDFFAPVFAPVFAPGLANEPARGGMSMGSLPVDA